MSFGLEQDCGILITPMALARPLRPINSKSKNKRRNLLVWLCVSSWWHLSPSRNSVLIYMYLYVCILYTSFVIGRLYVHTEGVSFSIGEAAPHLSL